MSPEPPGVGWGSVSMKASFYWTYGVRSLRRGGQRTVLAVFCIAVGVMAIVALQLASLMVSNNLVGNVRAANGGDISVHQDVMPFEAADLRYVSELKNQGIVTDVAAFTRDRGTVTTGRAASAGARARSTTGHAYPSVIGVIDPRSYPLVGQPDFTAPARGDLHRLLADPGATVLSTAVATSLNVGVGDRVAVHASDGRVFTLRVAGLINSGGLSGGVDAYVQQSVYQRGIKGALSYNELYLTTPDGARTGQATAAIKARYPLATVETVADALKARQEETTQVHQLLQVIGILALLIGGFGVVNTMNVLLARRRTEIAMLKTAGYQRRDLYALFGIEAALLGIVGGVLGAVVGVALSYLVKTLIERAFLLQLPFVVDPPSVAAGVLVGFCTALIFGLLPIVQAATVRPQAVLRDVPERTRWGTRLGRVALVLALSVLFCVLASVILGDPVWGIGVVYGTFIVLGALSLLFGLVVVLIGRLPVPETLSARRILFSTLGLLLALALVPLLPSLGVLLALVAAVLGYGVPLLPRSWKATVKMSLRDIGRQRARATMTLLALFVGVFSVGQIVVLGQDVRAKVADALANLSDYNIVSVVPARLSSQVEQQLPRLPGLQKHEVVNAVQSFPRAVNGRSFIPLMFKLHARRGSVKQGDLGLNGTIAFLSGFGGYDVARHQSTDVTIAKGDGRDLTARDAGTANVLLNAYLHTYGPLHLKLGDRVTLTPLSAGFARTSTTVKRPVTVTVVGFYTAGIINTRHFEPILAPRALAHRFGGTDEQLIYNLKVDPHRIDSAMAALNNGAPRAITINLTSLGAIVDEVLGNLIILLVALASLALFAGVIIIANSVALAMLERRREQGILKSVGYTSRRVLAGVLVENGVIGGLGGILGMLLVAVATGVLAQILFKTTLAVPGMTILALILLVTVIALVTSALVSWRAVRVRPIEVLRYE